jgi:hypothetical protein
MVYIAMCQSCVFFPWDNNLIVHSLLYLLVNSYDFFLFFETNV